MGRLIGKERKESQSAAQLQFQYSDTAGHKFVADLGHVTRLCLNNSHKPLWRY